MLVKYRALLNNDKFVNTDVIKKSKTLLLTSWSEISSVKSLVQPNGNEIELTEMCVCSSFGGLS